MSPSEPTQITPARAWIHRDLSWLQFNERVLAEAHRRSGNPILDRAKFLAISSANLDEFFMVRFASLEKAIRTRKPRAELGESDVHQLLELKAALLVAIESFSKEQQRVFGQIREELRQFGIILSSLDTEAERAIADDAFEECVVPLLDGAQTFHSSAISSLENMKLAVIFPQSLWFRIPRGIPSLIPYERDGKRYYFFLDQLLVNCLGENRGVPGTPYLLRITRDADLSIESLDSDPATIPDRVRRSLGSRELGIPARAQVLGTPERMQIEAIAHGLKLGALQCLVEKPTTMLHGLWRMVRDPLAQQRVACGEKIRPRPPQIPSAFHTGGIFERLRDRDYLLHHPYDSFDALVAWLDTAAADPQVEMIEQTIYRMDSESPLIDALKKAAARKKVRVMIELRARFDERNNLRLAEDLRKSGVEVGYGFGRLKLHAKLTLVSRREGQVLSRYTHLSTGNYNATTARTYTDLAVLTADADIGADARLFFDSAWEGKVPSGFKKLILAPTKLHRRLLSLIEGETAAARAGFKTRIVAKVNALIDDGVIRALYAASQAGVQVDLIVRGACSLVPGVPGLSENIRVISVVDRYLEHSRLYFFEHARAMYLSSADWMPRNFFSRLEIAFPILDPRIYRYVEEVLIPTYLADTLKSRELTADGMWVPRKKRGVHIRSQEVFESLAQRGYDGTPLH